MNITEFAEQIVFGKTLAEKLQPPGRLVYDASPRALKINQLSSPGRSPELQMFNGKGINLQPPSDRQLEQESARGQLLHFLANHELLATELMALVLLKFPDAPAAFRQGVLVTLQEEQEHTRMYLERMKEYGIEFGTYPLSGQFWRLVEPMQSPLDFVSRLSLTFEQANLDYSLHFANVFKQIGDQPTADLLFKIYQDEIGHVKHGLQWFRQWKNPEQSDWDAYQATLTFPMSPQRALGPRASFNRAGRQLAGLGDDYIDAIEVFRQSRGRSPTVLWFDPAAEAELSDIVDQRLQHTMNQLSRDLEYVMLALSKVDDVVLVRRMPSQEFRKRLLECGFQLPEFVLFADRDWLSKRKLRELLPWAWTPRSIDFIRSLADATHQPTPVWHAEKRQLFCKSWSAGKLKDWLRNEADELLPEWLSPAEVAGTPFRDWTEIAQLLSRLTSQQVQTALVKQELSASGRGQRRLPCDRPLTDDDWNWLRSKFPSRDDECSLAAGVVEARLDRVVDLSFLWHLSPGANEATCLGWTHPIITPGHRYAGANLGAARFDVDPEVKRFLLEGRGQRLKWIVDWLQPRISAELRQHDFSGYFGIDAFVYRDAQQQLRIKPIAEINPRLTMGHVALALEKRLARGTAAKFRILTRSEWEFQSPKWNEIAFQQTGDGWKSGVIPLTEVDNSAKLVPVLLIGETAVEPLDTKQIE